ncbi:3-hydroxyacyl-CoA dehydrogenase NAD-binding domain-containing protein [Solimonas variicoloris]|uniref:3-hydroxyacyl-CoA dehydrogenase NAD-binding domain-containing protein n=1 Tax=Solimonas variicoloris TaxID=254408 RepID=UPI0006876B09|nr:3-hydroxyacyl-CoA dehydrogenase NAD-binding domain-containing protein [Solimonas variicoloris]
MSHLASAAPVSYRRRGDLGFIDIDSPPVNALSAAVRAGLAAALDAAEADPGVRALLLRCRGRTFLAGADIAEFGGEIPGPQLPGLVDRIEAFPRPVIAALHGTALGGGLEVAMGCHYRIAAPGTKLGLPEVRLGLIPGAGGTQRLPRLVGLGVAMDMIGSGRPVDAARALAIGLVDRIADGELDAAALAYAEELVAAGAPPRRTGERSVDMGGFGAADFERGRAEARRSARGQLAPIACIDALQAACTLPLADGLRRENALFIDCYRSPQAQALWHVFFAERAAGVVPGIDAATPELPIARAAVIGAGTMGAGIAVCLADAGLPVRLLDGSPQALARGLKTIESVYRGALAKGRIDEATLQRRLAQIQPTERYEDLADADLVVEAVFESMDVKRRVFAELDRVCRQDAILATNTSTLDVDVLAASTINPLRVLGLHFFSPANVMRLLEIVRGAATAPAVLKTALKLSKRLGKLGIVSGVCYGFIGNRMVDGYLREAGALLLEGATPEAVDRALTDFGLAMGPFAMQDLAGLDVGWRVRQEYPPAPGLEASYVIADRLYALGRYGQKSGAGYYRYGEDRRRPQPDAEVEALIAEEAQRLGIARRALSADEIVERLVLPLINEGARILEEGIALRSSDIDLVWINGYGFPAWRGGPMLHADRLGLPQVVERLDHYAGRFGPQWTPAPLLRALAAAGRRLDSYTPSPRSSQKDHS